MTANEASRKALSAYLVTGSDPGLVSQALSDLLAELGSDDEESLVSVEEYAEPGRGDRRDGEELALGPILDACRTPPFLAERRVVVVRDTRGIDTSQVAALVSYLSDPVETTVLVLAHPAKKAPEPLQKAVRAVGRIIEAEPPTNARARGVWLAEHVGKSSLHLNNAALELVRRHLGEDLARLEGLLETLEATYGSGQHLGPEDVEPFLGEAGSVAPYELTDAIDHGDRDASTALGVLARLVGPGGLHPLQVLAILANHYSAMFALEGSGVRDEASAATITGLSPFPAKKALNESLRLGHDRLARAIELIAAADLDCRGTSGVPLVVVLEVLVARLCQLARLPGSPDRRPRPARARR